MNREILFKAKRIDNYKGEWVEGYLVRYGFTGQEKYYIVPDYASDLYGIAIDPRTICQYTGLTDKNGKKIWENDIVICGSKLIVTWNEMFAGWCLTKKGWIYNHYFGEACSPEDVEAIGNIFDNPELLEGGAEG